MNLSKSSKEWLIIAAVILSVMEVKTAHARSEIQCLARIGFAESQGESIKGVLAVMNASVLHAKQSNISVCKVKAKQQTPDDDVAVAYSVLAKNVLSGDIKPTSNANAWRSKGQRAKGGKQTAKIGGHRFFYVESL
jgi:hypothetical protein